MRASITRIENTAQGIKTFWFKPAEIINYQPGQYIELTLLHKHADDRGQKRWFTLSSSPSEDELSITTKFSTPGSTFKRALSKLQVASEISISNSMGDFVLPKDTSISLLFVAGGIGITPVRSIVKWLIDTHEKRNIELIYAVSNEDQQAFLDLFQAYCHKVTIIKSDQQNPDNRLSAKKILELTQNPGSKSIYLSGPEPMVEEIVGQFTKTNISDGQIITDYFPGYLKF